MTDLELANTLAAAFSALADEAQSLADRRTVLEHKLRFAHEQFQYLADKYAPAAPEIEETLAKLQLPPHPSVDDASTVPLPRGSTRSQHQIALAIRDGRRAASQLVSLHEASKTTDSTRHSFSPTSPAQSSISTALEQDFTVEGRRGNLQCPFSNPADAPLAAIGDVVPDGPLAMTPHPTEDPICAAMYEEMGSQSAVANEASGVKCPIRYMDKHSPEEIARYVETHKHELPRSHEVCLRRYQRNEEQIRMLDSKYGNVVNMIEDLSHLHRPMLPEDAEKGQHRSQTDEASNERVENWAHAVSNTTDPEANQDTEAEDDGREGHFDRPLKEVRVGESPSRPWGISVPVYEPKGYEDDHPISPPPAPVRMPNLAESPRTPAPAAGKCPFDHTKLSAAMAAGGHPGLASPMKPNMEPSVTPSAPQGRPFTPVKEAAPPLPQTSAAHGQPAFISPEAAKAAGGSGSGMPAMIFTGPVFIGYPMEQAAQLMNQYRGNQ